MARRVVLVRHGDNPEDDRVHAHLGRAGYRIETRHPWRGDMIGNMADDIAGTVFYGGPYDVFETGRYPFLLEEYRWLDACLKAGVTVLGICQGAQMIAWHLGAQAGPLTPPVWEFGYYRITPTPEAGDFMPGPLYLAQSHYHTFGIPPGAVRLAGSDLYQNQAFRLGDTVWALQFHAEQTPAGLRRWQDSPTSYFGKPGAQTRAEQDRLMSLHDASQDAWFNEFLARIFPAAGADAGTQIRN